MAKECFLFERIYNCFVNLLRTQDGSNFAVIKLKGKEKVVVYCCITIIFDGQVKQLKNLPVNNFRSEERRVGKEC